MDKVRGIKADMAIMDEISSITGDKAIIDELSNKFLVFNPHNLPVDQLPSIIGWNNGGDQYWLQGELIAEDGTHLGSHICSNEAFMLGDLGILDGYRDDRHEKFREHYPNGYKMEFVSAAELDHHEKLNEALRLNYLMGLN